MAKGAKVIVVMPAHNAAKTLEASYRRLPKKLVDEIILVDDASSDRTYAVAKKLPITVFSNAVNLGYGGNLKVCLAKALDRGADIIIEYHPDNQYDPSDLHLFLDHAKKGYDFALGSRFIHPKEALNHHMPLVKFMANRLLSFIDEFVLGLELSEFHSGFRMYTRKLLSTVSYLQNSDDYLFSFEIIVQAVYKKLKVAEIEISCDYHPQMHTANFKNSCIYAIGTFKTLYQYLVAKFLKRPTGPFTHVKPVSCPACGEKITAKKIEVRDPVSWRKFAIWYCTPCVLGFTNPIPADLTVYYPKTYYTGIKNSLYALFQKRRLEVIRKIIKKKGRILDVGCGEAEISKTLQTNGFRYTGIEAPFARVRNKLVKCVGIEGMREKRSSYDIVTFWETIEHLKNPYHAFKKSFDLLKPGGYLIIECPNFKALERKIFGRYWFHLDPPRHLFHFSESSLKYILEKGGFNVKQQEGIFAPEYTPYGLAQSILYIISPQLSILIQSKKGKLWVFMTSILVLILLSITFPLSFILYYLNQSPIMLTVAQKPKRKP